MKIHKESGPEWPLKIIKPKLEEYGVRKYQRTIEGTFSIKYKRNLMIFQKPLQF